jgi:hypothetical protein
MLGHFFAGYATHVATDKARWEAIVAASLVSQAIAFVIQLSIGLVCVRNQLARNLGKTGESAAVTEKRLL